MEQVQADYRIEIERPTDSETNRDWVPRILNVVVFSVLILAIPTTLVGLWGWILDNSTTGCLAGFTVGGIALAYIAPKRLLIYNQEWCGYVTQDLSGGGMVPYGPGLHASYLWEQRNADGNYSLKVKSRPFDVDIVTSTAGVTIHGEYEYAIDLRHIVKAIGVSEEVVNRGITTFIKNYLTNLYDETPAKVVKNEIGKMGVKLSNELMNPSGKLAAIRTKYGYKTVSINVDRISVSEEAQKTRDALDEADVLFEIVAKLHGRTREQLTEDINSGKVTDAQYQKMLTRAMAVSDNKTTIDVKVVEGLEGSPAGAVAATLGALSSKTQNGGKK